MLKQLPKSAQWLTATLCFSLLQLWYDLLSEKWTKHHIDWYGQFQSGILLFVMAATVVGIAVDFELDDLKSAERSAFKRFVFLFVPVVVLGLVFWAYAVTRGNVTDAQKETFVVINAAGMFLCAIYSFFTKAYLYS